MTNAELFDRYAKTRDIGLRNEIVEHYLYMADILIRKYLNKGVDYDDLYQVGAMALVSAVDRFDASKGYEFTSFATPTILGEIKKYFRDKEWSLKVPRRLKEISTRIPAAKEELYMKLQHMPKVSELAAYMGCSEEELLEAMESSKAYGAYSLNQTIFENEYGSETDIQIEKFTAIEDKGYGNLEYEEIIKNVVVDLSDKEKRIFQRRFIENKTQTEIAKEIKVSQMTVSRAEKNIKTKLLKELSR
ncbi:MAG: SigB/SigF/SigG family RNA polymerase sigma factor [Clostridiales bacterium]|nr:SigB/SigF/SigG family RNA polymerase sigma factor [Clostridiales bacterium]